MSPSQGVRETLDPDTGNPVLWVDGGQGCVGITVVLGLDRSDALRVAARPLDDLHVHLDELSARLELCASAPLAQRSIW